jgi:hypothetical protein
MAEFGCTCSSARSTILSAWVSSVLLTSNSCAVPPSPTALTADQTSGSMLRSHASTQSQNRSACACLLRIRIQRIQQSARMALLAQLERSSNPRLLQDHAGTSASAARRRAHSICAWRQIGGLQGTACDRSAHSLYCIECRFQLGGGLLILPPVAYANRIPRTALPTCWMGR